MSADAFNSNVDPAMAERAVQQLVYTATAAAASAGLIDTGQQIQVVVLVDGHTDYVAFNHVRLGSPTSRGVGMVAPVWIIDPQEGTSVADGAVKIYGRSTSREACSGGRFCGSTATSRPLPERDRHGLGRGREIGAFSLFGQPGTGQLRGPRVPD